MVEVTKEEFYQIIETNKFDVCVRAWFVEGMAHSEFAFRDRGVFGKVEQVGKTYPIKEKHYIADFYYKKYRKQ